MNESLSPWELAGKVLRRLIKDNHMTQEEFALEFGTDVRTINRYINGKLDNLKTIQLIAMRFNIDFRYFFDENNI